MKPPRPAPQPDSDPIGLFLVQAGLVTDNELAAATKLAAASGQRVLNILMAQGLLDSQRFAKFLASRQSQSPVDLSIYEIDPKVLALIPRDFALKHEVLPLDKLGKVLTIGCIEPLSEDELRNIHDFAGLHVKSILCRADDIRAALERYFGGEEITRDPATLEAPLRLQSVVAMVKQIESLPALPGTVHRVRELVYEEEASAAEVAYAISRDPAVAAKILRIANSAAYGLPNRVDTIQLAVSLLGLQETYSLVLASAIVNVFDGSKAFDYMTFWLESMVCASMATALSRAILDNPHKGVFAAGLLRDLGRVALAEVSPKLSERIDKHLVGRELLEAETRLFGVAHPEAGHELARHWALPRDIADTIRFHHTPLLAEDETRDMVAVVNIADVLTRSHRPDSASRVVSFEECADALAHLGLDPQRVTAVFEGISATDGWGEIWSSK